MLMIERKLGFSNRKMWQHCELLQSIVEQKVMTKVGRGKNAVNIEVYKYKNNDDVIKNISESIDYYRIETMKELEREKKITFRDYQKEIILKGTEMLLQNKFLYLAMEVRTGKTLTSLAIANNIKAQDVLFVTKKKAISSIEADFDLFKPPFSLCVVNYESLHKIDHDIPWDIIILDEAHSMGAFPKPSQRALIVRDTIKKYKPMVILLSGTPTPESYSQMYHQVYGIPNNPFNEFPSFYKFCSAYVNITEKKINGLFIRDYSKGLQSILDKMKPYTINYTQLEAGFKVKTSEHVMYVELKDSTYKIIDKLKKDLVVEGKEEVILADTAVKLMMKLHQLYSGTIKFESGNSMVLDLTKAEFIKSQFATAKIGIFYKFKEELNALIQVFGAENLTTDLSVFESTDKNIALQIVSGREGISLKQADCLVYYNIDFSATSYWQSKDRMTTKDRLDNDVYWIFTKEGIENDIYKTVIKKKDYTINHFKKTLL
jgi:hypothetical protein